MQNTPLRSAVIGVGYLGRFHAQKYQQNQHSQLIAVCDPQGKRAQTVAEELSCQGLTDYRSILDQVDIVSIASTTKCHYQIAYDCLSAGVHTLIEKPITTTVEQADELIKIAKENNCIIQVGHLERYNSAIVALKPYIQTPRFISAHRLANFNPRCTDVSVVLDLMIHDIDLVSSLIPGNIVDIQATGAAVLSNDIDLANVRLTFEGGCVANLTASRVNSQQKRHLQIFQDNGYMDVDLKNKQLYLHQPTQVKNIDHPIVERKRLKLDKNDALKDEIDDFIEHCITGTPPSIDGHAGRNALAIAIAISDEIQHYNTQYPFAFGNQESLIQTPI